MNYMLLNLPQRGQQEEIRGKVLKSRTYLIKSDKFHLTFPSRILIVTEHLRLDGVVFVVFRGNRIDPMKGIVYV
jgi:hypothetical protein